jgi:hypothetical protein
MIILTLTALAILSVSYALFAFFSFDWKTMYGRPLCEGALWEIIKPVIFFLVGIFLLLLAALVKINPFW